MNQNSQSSTKVVPLGRGNRNRIIARGQKQALKGSFGVQRNSKNSLLGSIPRFSSSHNKSATDNNQKQQSIPRKNYWNFEPTLEEKFSQSMEKKLIAVRGEQAQNVIKESLKNSNSSFKDTDTKAKILQKLKDNKYTFSKFLSSIDLQSQRSYESSEISFKSPENVSSSSSSPSENSSLQEDYYQNQGGMIQDSNWVENIQPTFGSIQKRQFSSVDDYQNYQSCHYENFDQSEYESQQIPMQHAHHWNAIDCHPNGLIGDMNHVLLMAEQQKYMPNMMLDYKPQIPYYPVPDFQNQQMIQNYQDLIENNS